MIATLIPYFLACNISAGPAWPYGPEYVYNLRGYTTEQRGLASPTKTVNFYTTIHCRPKSQATLSCILNNVTTSTENDGMRKDDTISDRKQFEVDFNEFGAENLTLPSDANESDKSFIRFFAPLFTVGSDLSGKTDQDGVFQTMNSSVERFKMNVKIGYLPETEEDSTDNLYELEILPGIDKPIGKAIEITKERDANITGVTWVGTSTPPNQHGRSTYVQRIEQLKYRLKISKHSFESYVHEKILLNVVEIGMRTIYDTLFEIKLTDVVPADEPIPKISKPETSSIFYNFSD